MDKNCNLVDSLIIKSVFLEKLQGATSYPDHVSQVGSQTFVYYPVMTPEPIVRDTLYELKENKMIPFLKLRFSNEGQVSYKNNKTVFLTNIWRSERFVFAEYSKEGKFFFMHDLKTGRSFNMKDGFDDDIHHTGKAAIHPLHGNYFYYLLIPEPTDENIKAEPNPDICIGKFL
jgi:hypothetical protein